MNTANHRTSAAAVEGARDAWDFWLSQHPLTVEYLIQQGVKDAVTEWLNRNGLPLDERSQ